MCVKKGESKNTVYFWGDETALVQRVSHIVS